MSLSDKYNSFLDEEKSLKEDLNKIKSDIKNEVLSLDVRIGLAQQYSSIENQLNQTISNRQQIEKELLSLQNEKLKKKNEEIELERQKTSFSLEWELMEAQAKGDESQIKATNEKIALNEVMNNLRQKGLFTEKEIAKKAKEYISLQKQIENNEKRKDEKTKKNAYEDFQNELKIKKLRAEGKNELADSLEIQKKAKELAKEWAIPYQDALDDLKELNKLENSRNQKKDKNSDPKNVKFGRTIKQLETEQTKIQKDLGSDNRYTVQKAKQRQKAYEDKYGINLNDDVRSYEGRDRKTGRLVNAKVGKEYEENQAYKQAKQRAFDMAKINKNKNNAQTPQVSTNLAQQTPQIPISQAQQSPATPAKNQNSQANQNTDQKSPNSNSQDSKLLQSMVNYLKELVSTQKQIKKKLADLENTVGKIATN